jgi:hypothetical protein
MAQWKPEDWEKFQQWRQAGAPPSNQPRASGGGWEGTAKDLLGATSATIGGLGKGAVSAVENLPGVGSIPDTPESPSPVMSWARSENKDYPVAEKAGRIASQYAPLAMLPESGLGEAAMSRLFLVPKNAQLPRLAKVMSKGLEGAWRGGVGGATQGDTKTGAATGAGTAAAASVLKQFPQLMWPAGFMAIEAAREGVKLPYGTWHLSHPLAALAAAALGLAPGVSGAIGARTFGEGGSGDQRSPENQ